MKAPKDLTCIDGWRFLAAAIERDSDIGFCVECQEAAHGLPRKARREKCPACGAQWLVRADILLAVTMELAVEKTVGDLKAQMEHSAGCGLKLTGKPESN